METGATEVIGWDSLNLGDKVRFYHEYRNKTIESTVARFTFTNGLRMGVLFEDGTILPRATGCGWVYERLSKNQ